MDRGFRTKVRRKHGREFGSFNDANDASTGQD